jgi:uncharacterized protein YjeT (DUF2065 family)
MRSIGLFALLLGALFFLYPSFRHMLPALDLSAENTRLLGGLLVAAGGISLALFRSS